MKLLLLLSTLGTFLLLLRSSNRVSTTDSVFIFVYVSFRIDFIFQTRISMQTNTFRTVGRQIHSMLFWLTSENLKTSDGISVSAYTICTTFAMGMIENAAKQPLLCHADPQNYYVVPQQPVLPKSYCWLDTWAVCTAHTLVPPSPCCQNVLNVVFGCCCSSFKHFLYKIVSNAKFNTWAVKCKSFYYTMPYIYTHLVQVSSGNVFSFSFGRNDDGFSNRFGWLFALPGDMDRTLDDTEHCSSTQHRKRL